MKVLRRSCSCPSRNFRLLNPGFENTGEKGPGGGSQNGPKAQKLDSPKSSKSLKINSFDQFEIVVSSVFSQKGSKKSKTVYFCQKLTKVAKKLPATFAELQNTFLKSQFCEGDELVFVKKSHKSTFKDLFCKCDFDFFDTVSRKKQTLF